jgi:hypothetical protein
MKSRLGARQHLDMALKAPERCPRLLPRCGARHTQSLQAAPHSHWLGSLLRGFVRRNLTNAVCGQAAFMISFVKTTSPCR